MNCHKLALRGLAGSVSAVALLASASAFAQDTQEDQATPVTTNAPTDEEEAETVARTDAEGTPATNTEGAIVVTGSRVKQPSTYNSISPLQVLTAEASRDVGEFDPVQVLQRSPAAAGTQIDATFGGFVLDNGPGSQTLNLRGLGAD